MQRRKVNIIKILLMIVLLLDDILFNTPSGAANFVLERATNGYIEWKKEEGQILRQLDRES